MVVNIKIFFLIILIFVSKEAYTSQKISIIRDAEIEFFLFKILQTTLDKNIKNNTYQPRLVYDHEYNAFVTGSNKIYINTGLIHKSNSLSEIQAVLAHEIGHLALNHFSTRLINSKNLSNYSKLATFAGIALSAKGKLNTNSALGLMIGSNDLAKKSSLQFSRIQEQQADKFALDQLIKNKISLNGFETLLINLANEEFNNSNIQTGYYRSHPFSKQRLQQVKKYKLKYQNMLLKEQKVSINENLISLNYIKNKIKSYTLDPYEIIKNLENKNGFLSNYSKLIALYRVGKYDLAEKKLSLIANKHEAYPFFYELKGDIYFKKGNFNNAINEYKKAILSLKEEFTPSTDLIKFSLIKTYLQKNNKDNLDRSITLLEQLLFNNPNWSYLWRLLSKASGKLNKKGIAYIALAEEALIKKNFIKAKKYVDLANKQTSLPISYKLRGSDILNKIKLKYQKK